MTEIDWIFVAFLFASAVHMLEEYLLPGGYLGFIRRSSPRLEPGVTVGFAIWINGLQILLCLAVIVVGQANLVFGLSPAGLLFLNAWLHLFGSLRERRYVAGSISALTLYLPVSLYAYSKFMIEGKIGWEGAALSLGLGLVYQLLPIGYLALAGRKTAKQTRPNQPD